MDPNCKSLVLNVTVVAVAVVMGVAVAAGN